MLVAAEQKKLVLATTRSAEIAEVIPGVRTFDHKGQLLTALDHNTETAQVLKNLGFTDVPSPIEHYYSWP